MYAVLVQGNNDAISQAELWTGSFNLVVEVTQAVPETEHKWSSWTLLRQIYTYICRKRKH